MSQYQFQDIQSDVPKTFFTAKEFCIVQQIALKVIPSFDQCCLAFTTIFKMLFVIVNAY